MKFKFLPLILAAACMVLPTVSCSRTTDKKSENPGTVYCGAESEDGGIYTADENPASEQSEIPEENPIEETSEEEQNEPADVAETENSPSEESAEHADAPAEEQSDEQSENLPPEQAETSSLVDESESTDCTEDENKDGANDAESGGNVENVENAENDEDKTEKNADVGINDDGTSSESGESENEPQHTENTAADEAQDSRTSNTESAAGERAEEKAVYVKCICTDLNIRSGAGTEYTSLGKAEKGTLFAYLGTENGWYKTYYKGEAAYLSAYSEYTALVELGRGDEQTENVISEGLKLIGTKYVYGAVRLHDGSGKLLSDFTPTEFDCSSLIQYIFYYGADVILEVNTRTQIYQGQYVHPSALQRGDCIYFTNSSRYNNSGVERIGHVALYLGDGYILHTASDYCKIEKISESRWNYYIEARRFI